jgi:hypothetical protein
MGASENGLTPDQCRALAAMFDRIADLTEDAARLTGRAVLVQIGVAQITPAMVISPDAQARILRQGDAAPKAPPARARSTDPRQNAWTREEEETAIVAIAETVRAGGSLRAGYRLAGERIGRSFAAVQLRVRGDLLVAGLERHGIDSTATAKRKGKAASLRAAKTAPAAPRQPRPAAPPARGPAPVASVPASQPPEALTTVHVPMAEGLALWQRELRAALNALGYPVGMDVETDLDLVEGLAKGQKLAAVAQDLELPEAAIADRWRHLRAAAAADRDFGISEQTRLLAELRARVAAVRGAAA